MVRVNIFYNLKNKKRQECSVHSVEHGSNAQLSLERLCEKKINTTYHRSRFNQYPNKKFRSDECSLY